MALVVQKYGGTSVANAGRLKAVAARVAKRRRAGDLLVVVLSAAAGETDRLFQLARDVTPEPDPRELDVLLATGEQSSVALFSMALEAAGIPAVSFLGFQARITTDESHGRARIQEIDTERILNSLEGDKVVVVAGFQGLDCNGNITTLGRGGSDISAVALAAALEADACEIYTDVAGVYTADPSVCPDARKLDRISYEEMLEMASLGAKVLQIRSVEFAAQYGMPVVVKSSFSEEEGTMVTTEDKGMEKAPVTGVVSAQDVARIKLSGLPDKPGVAAGLFAPLADAGINVDIIIHYTGKGGLGEMAFTVSNADLDRALEIAGEKGAEFGATAVRGQGGLAKVSIVGVGMRSRPGVASRMFAALAEAGINILMVTTSEIKVSCVIEADKTGLAVRTLHSHFGLAEKPECK